MSLRSALPSLLAPRDGYDAVNEQQFRQALESRLRSVEARTDPGSDDWVTILDYRADPTGVLDSAAAFTEAGATDQTIYVPGGTYLLGSVPTITTASFLVSPNATFTGAGSESGVFDWSRGYLHDKGNGSNFWRFRDRLLVDDANKYAGSTDSSDGATFIGDPAGTVTAFYIERSAALASISSYGGIGVVGGAQASQRYTAWGYGIWTTGEAVVSGVTKRGYSGRLYTAQTTGNCGVTPPTHTVGTVSDGAINWLFDDFAYTAGIGGVFVNLQDALDGTGSWALLTETVRKSGAGTAFGYEVSVKNKGSDITNDPYDRFPAGSTIGIWMGAGGDVNLGAAANPPTSAILIGSGLGTVGVTWNKGIVFEEGSITEVGGIGTAVALAANQAINWYASAGNLGFQLYSTITDVNERVSLIASDSVFTFRRAGASMVTVEHGGGGSPTAVSLRMISAASGGTFELRPSSGGLLSTHANTGLHILDPDASHDLIIAPGTNLSADRTLTLTTPNANQTIDTSVSGAITIDSVSIYAGIPQNSQSADYTLVLGDASKHIYHPGTDDNPRTFTIPANASVAYPVGTVITFLNRINTITIAITSDTLILAGTGGTGSRTLAAEGIATALKFSSTGWMISGVGLT